MDQKMARVDISLIVSDKSARIKKGRCVYIIASRIFQKVREIRSAAEKKQKIPHHTALSCWD